MIDHDSGDLIQGWIVPDNPLGISRVALAVDGRRVGEFASTIVDEYFRQSGMHGTGQCKFQITGEHVPGLAGLARLELYDADTNVLVYRRPTGDRQIDRRVMLVSTGIEPETAVQAALFRHFQHAYFGLHKLPEEIVTSILQNAYARSCLCSGAVNVPRYNNLFTPDLMLSAVMLHDPYVEMATRMHWLKARAATAADPVHAWLLGPLAEAARFAADYDYADGKALKRFFRMLPEPAYHLLYNPLTRQFGTRLPGDQVHPGNSIVAIDLMSRFDIVGHADYFEAFVSTLFDHLGIDEALPARPEVPPAVAALAARLRSVKAVAGMLDFDIAMSDAVRASVAKIWDHGAGGQP